MLGVALPQNQVLLATPTPYSTNSLIDDPFYLPFFAAVLLDVGWRPVEARTEREGGAAVSVLLQLADVKDGVDAQGGREGELVGYI
jgi:hypothetical protein